MRILSHAAVVLTALVFTLLIAPVEVTAQDATVRGFVTDGADGSPLEGVNVVLTNESGDLIGNATNFEGFYIIRRITPGTYTFRASFIGYVPHEEVVTVGEDEIVTVTVVLNFDEANLDEVVVEGERAGGGARVSAGLQTIRPQDMELVPAPDVSADLVNYLTTLPGVVASGDRGGQLFIRGGEPTQNLVELDGMLLYQPFHIVGFYSAFPADIVRVSDVYAGGFGAKYGGRLSSVIDVASRNGNNRRFGGTFTAAPFVSSALLEGPLIRNRASFLVSVRESVIQQGAANIIDENLPLEFGDAFGKLHFTLGANSQASVSALRTHDRGVIGVQEENADLDDPTQDQIDWSNTAVGARFVVLPSVLPMFAEMKLSYSILEQTFGILEDPSRETNVSRFNASADMTYFTGRNEVGWGLFLRTSQLENELGGQFQNVTGQREFITEAGVYVEPTLKYGSHLKVNPGVRLHAFPSKAETFIEPRIRLFYEYGSHSLSTAWGIYHQEIVGLNDRRDAGNVYTAWTSSPLGEVPEAMHFIGGYQFSGTNGFDFAVEGFYKILKDLVIPEWTAFPRFAVNIQPADGTVAGFDVRGGYENNWFKSFLSYGLSRVEYEATGDVIQLWFGGETQSFSPAHDRRHQVSALAAVQGKGFELSTRWQFGSGLPFNESVGFDTFVLVDGENDVREDPGTLRVLYGQPYTGRLPTYHRLDISLSKEFNISAASATVQAGVINIYDRSNLFFLDLFTLKRTDQLPLIPSLGLKLDF